MEMVPFALTNPDVNEGGLCMKLGIVDIFVLMFATIGANQGDDHLRLPDREGRQRLLSPDGTAHRHYRDDSDGSTWRYKKWFFCPAEKPRRQIFPTR